jgi:CHAD domain-containing protein
MEKYTGVGKSGRKLHEEGKQGDLEKSIPSPQEKTLLEQQAEQLDEWLRDERDRHAGRLQKQIEKRLPDVEDLSRRFLKSYRQNSQSSESGQQPATIALKKFVRLCEDMPQLNAGNLHDFRKKAKKARYLTESAQQSAKAKQVGAWIKEIQDVIGDWHDWLALSEEAKVALKDQDADLVKHLAYQVAVFYTEALKATEQRKLRLLRAASKSKQSKKPAGKASAGSMANGREKKKA